MKILRWFCITVGFVNAIQLDLMSDSVWQAVLSPLALLLSFFAYLLSYPLARYKKDPSKFAAEAREAKRKANEKGSSYDGGMD